MQLPARECFIPNREVDGELVNAINYVKETKKHECRIVYYSCHQ